jgi:alkylation response protein AidB-like acyl-CoA dehydrogenase
MPLAQAVTILNDVRAQIVSAVREYEQASDGVLESFAYRTRIGALKVSVSTHAVNATLFALQASGLLGYLNGTPQSLARHVRDICSAPIMVSNAKVLESVGTLSLIADEPTTLASIAQ